MGTAKLEKVPFEDALTMTGFGKFNYLLLLLTASIIMGVSFEIFSVSYLVTASSCELGTVSTQQGLMAGTPLVGIIVSSNFWGYLADTKGRRKVLIWELTFGFCAGFLATFSPNWIVFTLFKFASSCGMAGTYALALTLLGECTPQNRRSSMVALTSSIFFVCAGLMAILAMPVLPLKFSYYIPFLDLHFNSWRLLNLIYCIPCAISAFGVFYGCESPRYLLSVGQEEEALKILKSFHATNNGANDEFKVESVILDEDGVRNSTEGLWASIVSQTAPLMKPPFLNKTLLLSLMFVIVYFCLNPYMVWLPYISNGIMGAVERGESNFTFCQMLQTSLNGDEAKAADCTLDPTAMVMVFVIDILFATINSILTAVMSCCGRKTVIITIQLVSGAAGLFVNISSSWTVSIFLFSIYVAGVLNYGLLATVAVDIFPTYVKAMAVCLTLMVGRSSSVLGINILKQLLVDKCELSFYCFAGITIVGGLVGFLLPSEKPKVKKIES